MPVGHYDNSRRRRSKLPLKARLICKKCFRVTIPDPETARVYVECPHCKNMMYSRDRSGDFKKWSEKNPEKAAIRKQAMVEYDLKYKRERGKKTRVTIRKVIFNMLSDGEPKCANCGCDDQRILEINHINGGGTQESKKGRLNGGFYADIYMGRRDTSDLNLLCKVCNALHYLELKLGKLPFSVVWDKAGDVNEL
jgi:hypothetical protein